MVPELSIKRQEDEQTDGVSLYNVRGSNSYFLTLKLSLKNSWKPYMIMISVTVLS